MFLHRWKPKASSASCILFILGGAQLVLWLIITCLSARFHPLTPFTERPMLPILGLMGLAFVLYLASIRIAWCEPDDAGEKRRMRRTMWGYALLLRAVLLFSLPVQEIDYFRYLWDGRVTLEGVSPYAFSPAQVDAARSQTSPEGQTAEITRLLALLERSPADLEIFNQIDHRSVSTVYPPVSQLFFVAIAAITPEQSSVRVHILIWKSMVVVVDLIVTGLLVGILRKRREFTARALLYAWCPLTLKEFANSGHMDVIAIALLLGSLRLALLNTSQPAPGARRDRPEPVGIFSTGLWAAAVLAKLYPVVLAPLLWAWWRRTLSVKGQVVLITTASVVLLAGSMVLPSAPAIPNGASPAAAPPVTPHTAFSGLSEFGKRWEMNDMLFSLLHENLRPAREAAHQSPWYRFTSPEFRNSITGATESIAAFTGIAIPPDRIPFILTQMLMAGAVFLLTWWLALRPWPAADAGNALLQRHFGVLATLWYLSATQNPWYWLWVLPFALFVSRIWVLTAGAALGYYLRFWFVSVFPDPVFPGGLNGVRWFDEVLVWLEHLPILLLAAWATCTAATHARVCPPNPMAVSGNQPVLPGLPTPLVLKSSSK